MKYLKASIICFVCAAMTLWLMGCSNLYNSTPEFAAADKAYWKVKALALPYRGAERKSQLDKVKAGEPFYSNCDTFSRTVADLLVDQGAKPSDVWLVVVSTPVNGIVWEKRFGKDRRIKVFYHQIVEYKGIAIDNLNGVLPMADLRNYTFVKKMNMKDRKWKRGEL